MQVADSFNIRDWINMKTTLAHKDGWTLTKAFNFGFFDRKFTLGLSNEMSLPDKGNMNLFNPSAKITSSQIKSMVMSA